MSLATLAPEGQRTLCMEAGALCLARIRAILRQADPADGALCRLLKDVERRSGLQLDELREARVEADMADLHVNACFPSLRERLGEAPLTRDSALYYVERLKDEVWRFFSRLARSAADEESRALLTRASLSELSQVAQLRTVIL